MAFRMPLLVVALVGVFAAWAEAGPGKRGEPVKQSDELIRLVYPVGDLVVPIPDHWPIVQEQKPAKTVENELMALIQSTVAPNSWKAMGGAGILQYYPLGMALVVNQTRAVHDEIRDMLNALRRLQEVEVAVELRLVSMRFSVAVDLKALTHRDEPDSQWATDPNERIEQMLNASEDLPIIRFWLKQGAEQAAAPKAKTVGILSQKQLAAWLNLAQGDNGTNIMHAPKVTIFNGQHAGVVIAQQMPVVTEYKVVRENDQVAIKPNNETIELGLRCGLLPTVSADRRSVQLKVDFRHTELEGQVTEMPVVVRARRKGGSEAEIQAALQQVKVRTLTFKETCSIPDGRTLVVSLGQVTTDTRIEQGTPILKDIPFLGRCFTNVGYGREEREMFLFVTPRIIVTEAEEQPVLTEIPMPDGR